jgi:sialate O-acetylesterase
MGVAPAARAEIAVPYIFGDNMVLQRELPVPVWGTASPGEKVSVSFDGQTVEATADAKGKWMAALSALKASKAGKTLTVKGSNTITINNVLVGEVWLCSGQSNMAGRFVASKGRRIDPKILKTDLSRFRFSTKRGWSVLDSRTQNMLSCVGFYFGIELYRELGVPIGLVQCYHSGTPIQAWMPKAASEVIREKLGIPGDWNDTSETRDPGVQFEEKIEPIVPFALRGTIWYQGERNAKTMTGWEYRHLLPFLIRTWRQLWAKRAGVEVRKFPFYYVQVPTQGNRPEEEWPWLRNAMRRALDLAENTGMAVFYDYGPSLHPPNKQPAGSRLALWALARDYGRKDLVHSGPLLDKVRIEGNKAILSFKHAGGGLKSKSGAKKLKFFEIAGKDCKYVPADAVIEGNTVVVQNSEVAAPVHVRYLFRKPAPDPEVSLINAEGLPASSFMTDDRKPPR